MKRRRPKGTGTIETTRDGRFRARFAFKVGEREDIDGSPFPTHDEAERALNALLAELRDAGAVRGGVTLRKLGEKALAQRDLDGYRSVDADRDVWDLRVETWHRASYPASATTRGDVRTWLASMRSKRTGKPLAGQTRRNALNILRAVYAYGVENEIVDENPCDGIRIKDHGSTLDSSTFLSADEADALIAAATDPAVALAIGTGMRSGELRSLLWSDVHDDHITVRFGSPEKPTKNGKTRDIPILPVASDAIERLRKLREGHTGIAHEKVLPALSGGYRARGQVFDRLAWKVWLKSAGITRRVRPHDLRHTTATLLLTGAWSEPWTYEAVKEMLGHSSVKVTERYARATGTLAQRAARSMRKPETSPQSSSPEAVQAAEILQRRGSDSNRRMTVLQTRHPQRKKPAGVGLAGLCRALLESVAAADPLHTARSVELADLVWSLVESGELGDDGRLLVQSSA